MAQVIPPIPYDRPQTSFEWLDWYTKLINLVNSGSFPHNSLTGLQGGASGEYYHLTQVQKNDLTDAGFTTLHKHESHPVGAVIITDSATDPNVLYAYGTWTLLGSITI